MRLAKPEDAENYSKWLKADQGISHADPATTLYPNAFTAVVDAQEEPVLMQSAHPVLMLEALARRPDITPRQSARAINEMFEGMKRVAAAYGIKEIYFASSHEPLQKMVQKKSHKKHGIEKVNLTMYRVKVKDA